MGGSISGLSSGLDTESIIQGLMSIKRQRIDDLTAQKETEQDKENAWGSISTNMLSLQLSSYNLSKTATYDLKTASVSNENVLSATVSTAAVAGSYSFYVDQLATSHQLSTKGFGDYNTSTLVSSDKTITIELGEGDVKKFTELESLNGGNGISRGSIFLQDRDGNTATVDLSHTIDIYDVIDKINEADVNITARINDNGDGLHIDYTGASSTNNLIVRDISGGTTAADLGISTGSSGIAANEKVGTNIHYLSASTKLSYLNSGLGIEKEIFTINNGAADFDIDISNAQTIGDVLTAINNSGAGITASISADKTSISLSGAAITITEKDHGTAAQLGLINITGVGGDGSAILGGLGSVLLSSLNGATGNGVRAGSFDIIGDATETITVSAGDSLIKVINAINDVSSSTNVKARLNSAENGIELYHLSENSFSVTDSNTSRDLGLYDDTRTGSSTNGVLKGYDLDFSYINRATGLASLNQGDGVRSGSISITKTNGSAFTVNLSASSIKTIGDVIDQINSISTVQGHNIVASINSTGDGILISDTNGGAENLVIAEVGTGHTAADLGILGSTSGTSYNGSFEKSITVNDTYTLEDVKDAINDLNMDVRASIVNDGSTNPYRLILTAKNSGRDGRIIFDSDISSLEASSAIKAKDAVLIMGEPASEDAVFITNSSNLVSGFLTGATLDLKSVSTAPITMTISSDVDSIVEQTTDFVEKFNSSISLINEQLRYDASTGEGGPLFGDQTLMLIQQQVFSMVTRSVDGLSGNINSIAQVGLSIGYDGTLSLDESSLRNILQTDIEGVRDFFTHKQNDSLSATVTSSGVDAPWSNNGAKDGNTTVGDFADGSTGWQYDNGGYYELDFGEAKELTSLSIYGIDTNSDDVLSSYTVQYRNSSDTAWVDYTTVSGNTSKDRHIYFPTGLVTSKIRLNNLQGTGAKAKILDVQAFETVGLAGAMELALSKTTDASTGSIDGALDGIDDRVEVLDESITSLDSRLAIEEERIRSQWVQLEKLMGEMQNVSSWLSQQTSTLNSVWNYKSG